MNETLVDAKVNHPKHYTFGKYEVLDILEDWFPNDPLLWQVGKYLARANHKGELLTDLKKAAWYLDAKIKKVIDEGQKPKGYTLEELLKDTKPSESCDEDCCKVNYPPGYVSLDPS
jgi:hypothetical protein